MITENTAKRTNRKTRSGTARKTNKPLTTSDEPINGDLSCLLQNPGHNIIRTWTVVRPQQQNRQQRIHWITLV